MSDLSAVVIEADGGSRGNPGNAGYGAVVRDVVSGAVLAERAGALGIATNNVAEYSGLIAGLEAARDLGARRVNVRMDSKLVVEQMCGRWRVKHPDMRPLAARAAALVRGFDAVSFEWIPRAENTLADALANSAMDGKPVHRDLVAVAGADPADSDPAVSDPAVSPASVADEGTLDVLMSDTGQSAATTLVLICVDATLGEPAGLAKHFAARGGLDAVVAAPQPAATMAAQVIGGAVGLPVEIERDLADRRRVDAVLARLRARGKTVVVLLERERVADILRLALEAPPQAVGRLRLDAGGMSEVEFGADGSVSVRTVNDTSAARVI